MAVVTLAVVALSTATLLVSLVAGFLFAFAVVVIASVPSGFSTSHAQPEPKRPTAAVLNCS